MQSERSLAVSMPWQVAQWQRLEGLHKSARLPHALLLNGPAGTGKRRFALSLAQYLLCAQPRAGLACGECRQCGLNKARTHPDLKLLEPEEKSKQIKIDQVRGLVDYLGQTSQQGGYKVAVVSPAEVMNINAANGLLKSLEEPSEKTLLLLLSDRPSQLLATIRSRCQSMTFPIPPAAEAIAWLAPQLPSPQQAEELLAETAGQPVAALDLMTSDGLARRKQFGSDYLGLGAGQLTALAVAEKWLQHDMNELLTWLARKLTRMISFRVGGASLPADWQSLAMSANVEAVFKLLDSTNLLQARLRSGANPNMQLALEALLLESCDIFHS